MTALLSKLLLKLAGPATVQSAKIIMAPIIDFLRVVLGFGFTVRVWMIIAAVVAHFWTKETAIREAMRSAIAEHVAESEINAEKVRTAGERLLRIESEKLLSEALTRQRAYQEANHIYHLSLTREMERTMKLEEEIDALNLEDPGSRRASNGLVDRLRRLERAR